MLTPYLPYPPVSGGRTRTVNLVRRLSSEYRFTVVCFGRPEERSFDVEPFRQFSELYIIDREPSPSTLRAALLSLTSIHPITQRLYHSAAMTDQIRQLAQETLFSAIHVESFYMMQNIPEELKLPVLLSEPSIEFVAWGRFAKVAQPLYQRPALWLESLKMRMDEPKAWEKATYVGVMSEFDQGIVKGIAPRTQTVEVPNGVDIDYFHDIGYERDPKGAIYMGDYKYFPNTEAIFYFMSAIMPLVRAEIPDFTLTLLGKDAPQKLIELSQKPAAGLKVLGLVDDTRPYLNRAGMFICPQRSGGGTRYKLLEAMACGCPVVSTTLGAEGLEAEHQKHLLIADSPREFADAILTLVRNTALARTLGAAGRTHIKLRHSWERGATKLKDVYRMMINGT
jgi:glycosyltransferase involved in cell wall biosynthesis